MIDSKRLDEIEEAYEKNNVWLNDCMNEYESFEIIRLARIGLWAQDHGIPAIEKLYNLKISFRQQSWFNGKQLGTVDDWLNPAPEALAALPKYKEL